MSLESNRTCDIISVLELYCLTNTGTYNSDMSDSKDICAEKKT